MYYIGGEERKSSETSTTYSNKQQPTVLLTQNFGDLISS